jgi:hypothetical protein
MSSSLSSLSTGDIAGIAVGGVLALVTVIGIVISCCAMCGKKNNPPQVAPYPPYNYQQNPYGQQMNTGYYGQQQQPWPPQQQYYEPRPANNSQQQYYEPRSANKPQQQPYESRSANRPQQQPYPMQQSNYQS